MSEKGRALNDNKKQTNR
ncbi:BH3307 [Halalkalibacterium halodurans C-125]|uniref:BH3307 protein n=1 Tax=Halalkalibacterium halodurans (strain ATCC BAA-125 / DSM 18197 / FERM 7344 / JCM 9153 / C-125) TaxID=272558 RepID=Q9K7Q4_HALH5|nr:BH3307 [Halalkalibacterium halodurans C-125]